MSRGGWHRSACIGELAKAGLGERKEGRERELEVLKSGSASRVDGVNTIDVVGVARDIVEVARVP